MLNKPTTKNTTFVFIKPHAVTEKVKEPAMAGPQKAGLEIAKEGSIKAEVIDNKKLIDQCYYAIASKGWEQLWVPHHFRDEVDAQKRWL